MMEKVLKDIAKELKRIRHEIEKFNDSHIELPDKAECSE